MIGHHTVQFMYISNKIIFTIKTNLKCSLSNYNYCFINKVEKDFIKLKKHYK